MKLLTLFTSLSLLISHLLGASATPVALSKRASLTQIADFGPNPANTSMYIYVPTYHVTEPAVVVALHYCGGTAQDYYARSPYAQLADQHGFLVVYPQTPPGRACWDVSSQAALAHNGGGESASIANMVAYTVATYGANASRVFVTGSSSGAMMTVCKAADDSVSRTRAES